MAHRRDRVVTNKKSLPRSCESCKHRYLAVYDPPCCNCVWGMAVRPDYWEPE